jgi:predicted acyltransferase
VNQRFYSLDVFRGMTVALMILVNNPGTWGAIFDPLEHAAWHGCTPTDLVFPFFLFAVGNAMAFVMPRLQQAGDAVFWKKVGKRTLLIFGIGLFVLAWGPYLYWNGDTLAFKSWEMVQKDGSITGIRIMGVLQRIALCYFFASVIVYYTGRNGAFYWAACLLLAWWVYCFLFGNGPDPYRWDGYFGTAFDKAVLGEAHMYSADKAMTGKPFLLDPEGLASTLPAIASVLYGYLAGDYIQRKGKTHEMVNHLFMGGVLLTVTGLAWAQVFPLNKKIWTSSYVVYTTGLAVTTIAALIFLIEFKNQKGRWSRFFDVFGKNPLFIFVLAGFLPRVLGLIRIPGVKATLENGVLIEKPFNYSPFSWFYEYVCKPIPGRPEIGSFVFALVIITLYWSIAAWMDRRKIYVKV